MPKDNKPVFELKLFEFGRQRKLALFGAAFLCWIAAGIAYNIPGFDYGVVSSFNSLHLFLFLQIFGFIIPNICSILVGFPLLIIYDASFKIDKLKPYRLVIFLTVITSAIGNSIIEPILKDLIARPRPFISHPDINSLYFESAYSFPSIHAFPSFATILPLTICFLSDDENFKRTRKKNNFNLPTYHLWCNFGFQPDFGRCALPIRCSL